MAHVIPSNVLSPLRLRGGEANETWVEYAEFALARTAVPLGSLRVSALAGSDVFAPSHRLCRTPIAQKPGRVRPLRSATPDSRTISIGASWP